MNLHKRLIPNIHSVQSFVCAAKHASFTQAAVELHLTQSAISRQIKELENQLGVALFERVRQRVVLTDSGSRFLEDAQQILHATEQAMLHTMSIAGASSTLNIAALPTFTSRWLIPRLSGYIKAHPNTALSFSSKTEPFDFSEKNVDLAIHFGKPTWPQARCYLICREQLVPVASRQYIEQHALDELADIQRTTLLQLTTRLGSWKLWFDRQGLDTATNTHLCFDQFSMIIDAVVAGLGVALLPSYFIADELARGDLVQLAEGSETDDCYYLVIPDDRADNPQAIAFKNWLLSCAS
ncbi:MAG: LysR family transcriptional regulator [Pseudomonadales bacterium]